MVQWGHNHWVLDQKTRKNISFFGYNKGLRKTPEKLREQKHEASWVNILLLECYGKVASKLKFKIMETTMQQHFNNNSNEFWNEKVRFCSDGK